MESKHYTQLAVATCALSLCGSAHAVYTELQVVNNGIVNVGGVDRQVWRVYAVFSDADDYLLGVNGTPTNGALVIQSRNATDTAMGGNFFNPGGSSSNLAPPAPDGTLEYGTFATIGVALGQDAPGGVNQTMTNPGFPNFINGNQLTSSSIGWFLEGPMEQGRAGYAGDGDSELRVLLTQLTVNAGENVRGSMNVAVQNNTGLAGGEFLIIGAQTFNSVPAPGGFVLLALGGMMGTRRRSRFTELGNPLPHRDKEVTPCDSSIA